MWIISYWVVPLFSAIVWLAMLLALFLNWIAKGKPIYPSMGPNQSIAYISDEGAQELKPLFIAMGGVSVISFDLGFILERWLRHKGRLVENTSNWQKLFNICSALFGIIGAAGLILLAIFDTLRHERLHQYFLIIGGYILIHYRQYRILRASFWVKLTFIFLELALCIAFGVTQNQENLNTSAILEWVIALVYTFYVLCFFIDFIPAVRTKHHQSRETSVEMGLNNANNDQSFYSDGATHGRTNGYTNGTNGYANGYPDRATNGYANGYTRGNPNSTGINGDTYYPDGHPNALPKPVEAVPPSRNF
ncbi:hypothetical protein H2199_003390 [Coniosporium tulheliwenetii]|uniref:Uncharacterized protein n=1 Tax=Coniosporium tulheliwenetii TaxID=3383036 RepID=A0ACC2ZC37_9PEZI|nr:hypothetical protein H2199_003390 [Cladosporium sp. JES 115]